MMQTRVTEEGKPAGDGSSPRKPPVTKTGAQATGTSLKDRPPADRKLGTQIAEMYGMFSLALVGIGVARDDAGLVTTGELFSRKAEQIAEAWLDLASQSPAVKAVLKKVAEGGLAGGLILLHLTCFIPLLVDRGILPASLEAVAVASAPQNGGAGVN